MRCPRRDDATRDRSSMCRRCSGSRSASWVIRVSRNPLMMVIGVRSSWDTRAMKSDFSRSSSITSVKSSVRSRAPATWVAARSRRARSSSPRASPVADRMTSRPSGVPRVPTGRVSAPGAPSSRSRSRSSPAASAGWHATSSMPPRAARHRVTRPRGSTGARAVTVRSRIDVGSRAVPTDARQRRHHLRHTIDPARHAQILPGCERGRRLGKLDRPVKSLRSHPMATAVIVDAVRTAGGKRNGKLSGWHPADLAAEVLKALAERNDLDPALIDDVIMGCVMQVGNQGLNIGRNAVLAAGFPESRARHHRRPPVRLVAAGGPLRRPGRHRRRLRHRHRRRRRGHDHHPDGRVDDPRLDAVRSQGAGPLPAGSCRRASRPR